MSHKHRIGARKHRNGKSGYEKNQWRCRLSGQKRLIRGYRGSDKDNPEIPVETLKQLDYMYGDFSDELAKLDDVEIRKKATHRTFAMTYLKNPYLNILSEQASHESKAWLKKHNPKIYTILRKMKQLIRPPNHYFLTLHSGR